MPKYRVTLSDGRIVTLEAATQPSEAQILATIGQPSRPAPMSARGVTDPASVRVTEPPAWNQPGGDVLLDNVRALADLARGGGAGLASTIFHGGDVIRRATGMERVIERPAVQAGITPPQTGAGKAGFYTEQAAEYALPLSRLAQLTAGSGVLARAGLQGLGAAGVAGAQSGGDPATMMGAGTLGAAAPFVGAAAGAVGSRISHAAAGAKEGGIGGALAGAIRTVAPSEPKTLLIQALKPRATQVEFASALDRAIPEIKSAEQLIGHPVTGLDALVKATQAAKKTIQQQLNQMRGAQRAIGAEVDLSQVANAMARSIPRKVALERPGALKRLLARADSYRRSFTLDEAEILLRETNAELDGFYAMYPQAQRSALVSNPGVAALEAQAKALRDAIYNKLDAPGLGTAARELNRRYGALMEVEGTAFRRLNVAARQQPESLSEQIGAVRAAGEYARGTWRLLHGDVAGAADVAAARAGRSTARAIKESQTTDALIRRAMASVKEGSMPVDLPAVRPITGLLTRGSLITQPSADTSYVRSVPAKRVIVREKTGRMRRMYTTEPK